MTRSRFIHKLSVDGGVLFVVATPIGNLQDLSPRAKDVLRDADLILVEDTRISSRLLHAFDIVTPVWAYHDHNERRIGAKVIARLEAGDKVALISDAGTPLIRDPGYHLVSAAHRAGLRLISVPGPSAVIAALAVSGLPSDRFVFEGFLPGKIGARRRHLEQLRQEPRTMVFFEAPHRVLGCVTDMVDVFGGNRWGCVARELSKIHETTYSDPLSRVLAWLQSDENRRKGEFVLLVAGIEETGEDASEARRVLEILLEHLPLSQAAAAAGAIVGISKHKLYRWALDSSA